MGEWLGYWWVSFGGWSWEWGVLVCWWELRQGKVVSIEWIDGRIREVRMESFKVVELLCGLWLLWCSV